MKCNKKEVIVLKDKWITSVGDVPEPRSIEMVQVTEEEFREVPFPMDLEAQKRLLELIYNRKSGIITRQELIDVLFNQTNHSSDHIIRYRA